MSAPIVAAVLAFFACLGVSFALQRRRQDRLAFAALLAAPLAAAMTFVGVGALPRPAAANATAANATAANATAATPESTATPAPSAVATAPTGPGVGSALDRLRHEAEDLRHNRRFAEAREAYARITKTAPFDADAWADLGDASAAAAGGDLKAGSQAIDRALELDPNHAKALWLKASLELQEKRYSHALEFWQRLLARLPSDSNDARIVSANVAETRALAAQQGAAR